MSAADSSGHTITGTLSRFGSGRDNEDKGSGAAESLADGCGSVASHGGVANLTMTNLFLSGRQDGSGWIQGIYERTRSGG